MSSACAELLPYDLAPRSEYCYSTSTRPPRSFHVISPGWWGFALRCIHKHHIYITGIRLKCRLCVPYTYGLVPKRDGPPILSSILLPPFQTKVTPNLPTLRLKRNLEKLVPVENVHSTRNEGKVVAAARDGELSDQSAGRIPTARC